MNAKVVAPLTGIIPAVVTPFSEDGSRVDEAALQRMTEYLIGAGVGGLVTAGSSGEFLSLSPSERRRVTEVVVEVAAGRTPIVAQTGATTTSEAVNLSEEAERAGANALMVLPPYGGEPPWGDLLEYFRAIASSVSLPIIFYYIPSVHGYTLTINQICEIAAIDKLDYIKDSSGDLAVLVELIECHSTELKVITAWDTLNLYGFVAGSRASISGTSNFIPELWIELFEAVCHRSDLAAAQDAWHSIWAICSLLDRVGYVAGVKAGCELVGHPVGPPRAPLRSLEPAARAQLEALLQQRPARKSEGGNVPVDGSPTPRIGA